MSNIKFHPYIYQKALIVLLSFEFKSSLLWALLGVVIGIIAFGYNYTFAPASMPGYEFFTVPARLALSFFSEETSFWPKMIIFLNAQYLGFFVVIFTEKTVLTRAKS